MGERRTTDGGSFLCKSRGIVLSIEGWAAGPLIGCEEFAELLNGCVASILCRFGVDDSCRSHIVNLGQ